MAEDAPVALMGDLLLYNAEFQCCICKECEYAVQPAAIPRHLKQRHKIYRKDREEILAFINHLPLVDPTQIQHREYEDPIPFLAVLRGLYCTAGDCRYLCESLKRMQQHWAATHNRTGTPDIDWRSTLMQTFFRGTCTRYFRVRGDPNSDTAVGQRPTRSPRAIAPKRGSLSDSSDNQISVTSASQADVNLSDLALFHQYLNITSKTIHCSTEPSDFWTTTVPQFALEHSSLMHGILATAAMHLACLYPKYDAVAKRKHIQLGSFHQHAGLPGFRTALDHPDKDKIPLLLGFSKLLLLQEGATLQCVGIWGPLCRGLPGCNNWHSIIEYLHFARRNTAMIFSIMGHDRMKAVMRFVPAPPYDEASSYNPSVEPMQLLHEEIMWHANDPQHNDGNRAVLLDMWQHLSNVFAIEFYSQSGDRHWEAIIYLSAVMSLEFLELLENHDTLAKLLLAYYAVVIGYLGNNWWLVDHGKETFAEVKRHTERKYWHLIEWPGSQVEVDWVT